MWGAVWRKRDFDDLSFGVHALLIPIGFFVTRPLNPDASVQSQKLTARVNCGPGGCLLNVEDLNPQQAVSINLRGVRHHRSDDFDFRLDGFVALEDAEIGDGLAGL